MRFGLRAKSVADVNKVKAGLISSRRIIFTPDVDLKDELSKTAVQITCYDREGKEVKRVTSTSGDVEEDNGSTEDNSGSTESGSTDNSGNSSSGTNSGSSNSGSGSDNSGDNSGGDGGGDDDDVMA
jgi:hypothetical protein